MKNLLDQAHDLAKYYLNPPKMARQFKNSKSGHTGRVDKIYYLDFATEIREHSP